MDPSHTASKVSLVLPLAKTAIGAGVDGLTVETYTDLVNACSGVVLQIVSGKFSEFMDSLRHLIEVC